MSKPLITQSIHAVSKQVLRANPAGLSKQELERQVTASLPKGTDSGTISTQIDRLPRLYPAEVLRPRRGFYQNRATYTALPATGEDANVATEREKSTGKRHSLLVGNMGLYAVCYELSRRGWNVMPTSRNARGIDVLGYSQCGRRTITVQVKALSKRSPVPLGSNPNLCNLIAEFVVIARGVRKNPAFFVATTESVRPLIHVGEKNGKTSYWLQQKQYEQFENQWETIGEGW